MRTVRHEAFGFSLPSLSGLAKGLREEPIDAVTSKVVSAREESSERWLIETEEHTVRRQTQSSSFPFTPRPSSNLIIKPGAPVAFFCQIDGQASLRCRRDR